MYRTFQTRRDVAATSAGCGADPSFRRLTLEGTTDAKLSAETQKRRENTGHYYVLLFLCVIHQGWIDDKEDTHNTQRSIRWRIFIHVRFISEDFEL